MKLIGIIGGLSAESSAKYYQWLNAGARERLGGLHQARILMTSVDFQEFVRMKQDDDWDAQREWIVGEARRLDAGGADFIIMATNTMHKFADDIQAAISVPFLHIADATANAIKADGKSKIGLLGTIYTMEEDFYRGRLEEKHGLEVLVPEEQDRAEVSRVIYDELCRGEVKETSRDTYRRIVDDLAARGAEGVILGCTEITMLIGDIDLPVPAFDTTRIHVEAALEDALEDSDVREACAQASAAG